MRSRIADRRGRPARQTHRRARRGAAMIIVIAIMTILLAIALTFFTVTKLEVQTATNVRNIVDVDLLADAAIAITQAHLNQDLFRHPEYTSLDHGWKTLFNGAAYVGKPWALAPGPNLQNKGLIEIDHSNLPALEFEDGHREILFNGPYSRDWKAIPRFEGTSLPLIYRGPEGQRVTAVLDPVTNAPRTHEFFDADQDAYPFVTASYYGQTLINGFGNPFADLPKESGILGDNGPQYPFEQIHEWADVDNDGDGYRDSLWLPIPRDLFFENSNADEDLDGIIDETQDNGINDDRAFEALDSVRRTDNLPTNDEIAANPNTQFFVNDPDEAIEAGTFVYWGGDDGLDNDRDGFIDQDDSPTGPGSEPYEFDATNFTVGYFLTAPLPGIQMSVDFDADGVVPDFVPIGNADTNPGAVRMAELRVQLPDSVRVLVRNPNDIAQVLPVILTANNVDRLDNDFDLTVNDYYAYAYVGPSEALDLPPFRVTGFTEASPPEFILDNAGFNSYITSGAPIPSDFAGSYYAIWRQEGNWYISDDGRRDVDLFDAARERGYTEINSDTSFDFGGDGTPDFQVIAVLDGAPPILGPTYTSNGFSLDYNDLREVIRLTHSGEPVCELVGRMAVLVNDEASKPNLNVIGGHTYEDEFDRDASNSANIDTGDPVGPLKRALNDGATTAEYETRVFPDVGFALASRLDGLRNGVPPEDVPLPVSPALQGGNFLGADTEPTDLTIRMANGEYYADVSFPGYGRADDNGNAFLLSINGIDDDGDGLVDEGLYLPELSANALAVRNGLDIATFPTGPVVDTQAAIRNELEEWTRYYRQLGHFEGIDEPGEFQSFAPYRHEIAERDEVGGPLDNDGDGVPNEIGELGDNAIKNRLQIQDVAQIGPGIGGTISDLTTMFSSSKNLNFINTESGLRGVSKIDPRYGTPQQIAATLLIADEEVRPITDYRFDNPNDPGTPTNYVENPITREFAEGLRQKDVHLSAPGHVVNGFEFGGFMFVADNVLNPTVLDQGIFYDRSAAPEEKLYRFPADPMLRAMQAAVDTVDNRDADHARSALTTENRDQIREEDPVDPVGNPNPVPFPTDQNGRERVPDRELLNVESIEETLEQTLGETSDRRLESIDEWWADRVQGFRGLAGQAPAAEERRISYTTAGIESIVINELMVRPVRRVEAEMVADAGTQSNNRFDPSPFFDLGSREFSIFDNGPGADIHVLPYFDVQRDRIEDSLTTTYTLDPPAVPKWFVDGFQNPNEQVLGEDTWVGTGEVSFNARFDAAAGNDVGEFFEVGNVLQYLVAPSDGLPPGRYYLSINIEGSNLSADNDLSYAIKYILPGGQTIIDDIVQTLDGFATNNAFNSPDALETSYFDPVWAHVPEAHFSHRANIPGEPEGWVFIDGTPDPTVNPNANMDTTAILNANGYYNDGGDVGVSPNRFTAATAVAGTHTVTVPSADSGIVLCIAVRKLVDDGEPLAINFLDFSQEPDHEYIELANNSDEEIDLSGWELEVGIPDADGVPVDPNKSTWAIPDNTRIAPNGMLLLGFNKFDYYQSPNLDGDTPNLINQNGMGLASGVAPFDQVTMPPFGLDSNDPRFDPLLDPLVDPLFAFDTVPEVAGLNPRPNDEEVYEFASFNPTNPNNSPNMYDPTGSVFRRFDDVGNTPGRNELVDYVDNDGDGIATNYRYEGDREAFVTDARLAEREDLYFDTDNVKAESETVSTTTRGINPLESGNDPTKPWDRIVGLVNISLDSNLQRMENIQTVEQVARLVLRGGVLPNYPERDRIDNDGDGGYVTTTERSGLIVPVYVPGTLDKDMIDNDGDGLIDEQAPGTDDNEDGTVQPTDFDGIATNFDEIRADLSEGVDEGKPVVTQTGGIPIIWRRYGPGSYDVPVNPGLTTDAVDVLPAAFFTVRNFAPEPSEYFDFSINSNLAIEPYAFMVSELADPTDPTSRIKAIEADFFSGSPALDLITRLGDFNGDPIGVSGALKFINEDAHYLGSDLDPPDWKAFAERRWNPGDNVVVSLLDSQGRVADRVTYRELDVTNRTVDDVIPSPYVLDINGDGNFDHLNNDPTDLTVDRRDSMHPNYATFWRPNHMALDFYRSLERKHPTYTGDRFGTQNRWQATDGNYDDWAESPSVFEANINAAEFPQNANQGQKLFELRLASSTIGIPNPPTFFENERLFRHAFFGSPLRANLTHRISANTTDTARRLVALGEFPFQYLAERIPYDSPSPQPPRFADQFYAGANQRIGLDATTNFGNPVLDAELIENPDWTHARVGVKNDPVSSIGELNQLPGMSFQHVMVNSARYARNPRVTWLNDFTRENSIYTMNIAGANRLRVRQDLAHRGAILGYDETNAEPEPDATLVRFGELPNSLDPLINSMSTESIILTVGQADFTPVRPNPFDSDAFEPADYPAPREFTSSDYQDLLAWIRPQGISSVDDGISLIAPAVWVPVFLFELPGDFVTDSTTFPPGRFPFYPSFPSGENVIGFAGEGIGLVPNDTSVDRNFWPMQYLFNSNYLFENRPASFSLNLSPAAMQERWPLEQRTVMYVAEHRNIVPGVPMEDDERAEAVFSWTAEDGLQNGEYVLYIGTYLPNLDETIRETAEQQRNLRDRTLTMVENDVVITENTPLNELVETNDPTATFSYSFAEDTFAELDPNNPGNRNFDPQLGIDVITDRTRARGLAPRVVNPITPEEIAARAEFEATGVLPPGLAHPDDWQPSTVYTPGSDGYIFYSDSGEGGWKPILVRVTNNFLAIRVRNLGQPGQVAAISHVVLAPRKRTPGKININTVTPTVLATVPASGGPPTFTLFDSLLGLPGVVDVAHRAQVPPTSISPTDDVGLLTLGPIGGARAGIGQARPAPLAFGNFEYPPTISDGIDDPNDPMQIGNLANTAAARTQLSTLIIAGREHHSGDERTQNAQHFDARYYASIADLVKESSSYVHPDPTQPTAESEHIHPLSNQRDPELRFDEATERFRRMSNLITTRSDVFEIIATVQAGYGVDQNGDGRINYRTSDEFVTTAETKTRMVYERRTPSDSSDINDTTD